MLKIGIFKRSKKKDDFGDFINSWRTFDRKAVDKLEKRVSKRFRL